jgi:predicted MFS family arabinose efflux permease
MGVGLSSLAELLDKAFGWRASIRYIGLVCVGFSALLFCLTEPSRNQASKKLVSTIANDDYMPSQDTSAQEEVSNLQYPIKLLRI